MLAQTLFDLVEVEVTCRTLEFNRVEESSAEDLFESELMPYFVKSAVLKPVFVLVYNFRQAVQCLMGYGYPDSRIVMEMLAMSVKMCRFLQTIGGMASAVHRPGIIVSLPSWNT